MRFFVVPLISLVACGGSPFEASTLLDPPPATDQSSPPVDVSTSEGGGDVAVGVGFDAGTQIDRHVDPPREAAAPDAAMPDAATSDVAAAIDASSAEASAPDAPSCTPFKFNEQRYPYCPAFCGNHGSSVCSPEYVPGFVAFASPTTGCGGAPTPAACQTCSTYNCDCVLREDTSMRICSGSAPTGCVDGPVPTVVCP